MTWVRTYSGESVDLLFPEAPSIRLSDIAWALSHQCRYNGHGTRFYSVAEHSIHVAARLPPELRHVGLLHDAAETYIGDIVSPLKDLLPLVAEVEARLMGCILAAFGLDPTWPPAAAVREADRRMIATEVPQLFKKPFPVSAEGYSDLRLECWPPGRAAVEFLNAARDICKVRAR